MRVLFAYFPGGGTVIPDRRMETDLMATTGEHAEAEQGHSAARRQFSDAVRANQSMVFSIAYHFLRDWTAAEEVAQDVFLQLYRKYEELESDSHVIFWLRRVTSHRCVDYA